MGSSIDGVIVSVLTFSVVDRGFEHRWCNSKRADFECSRSCLGSSIGGVIVTVLTLSVVDRGFEHRWCNSKRADFECSRSWDRASVV